MTLEALQDQFVSHNEDNIVTRSVEEIIKGFLWVADENTPLTTRFELVVSLTSHESLATLKLDVV